jgi:uncharacterized protein YgbK (DUF1537 family)
LDRLVARTNALVVDAARAPLEWEPDPTAVLPDVVVVETIRSGESPDLAAAAARTAAAVLDRLRAHPCAGVVVSGGRTAARLAEELGGRGIRVEGEARPLCGAGTLIGGRWDGLRIVAKGGLVGDDSTLDDLVAWVMGGPGGR